MVHAGVARPVRLSAVATAAPSNLPTDVAAPILWLFDLDNTLHDASHAIFPAIHLNMNRFIGQTLEAAGLPADAAAIEAARQGYWRRYGATLLGMVKHHQVRAEDFLREAHHFDDLAAMIRSERGLAALLKQLPGRKILLTNAPYRYSREVVRHLKLHRHFSQHIAIESMQVHRRLQPKPSKALLRRLLKKERVKASRCVLVEDTLVNLRAAKAVGMGTVLITRHALRETRPGASVPALYQGRGYVDLRARSLIRFLNRARSWRTQQ